MIRSRIANSYQSTNTHACCTMHFYTLKLFPLAIAVFLRCEVSASSTDNDTIEAVKLFMEETNSMLSRPSYPEFQKNDVKFLLVTRETLVPMELNDFNLGLVNKNRTTIFVVVGWLQMPGDEMYTLLTDAYLENGDYNVIQVDTSKYMFYPQPVSRNYSKPIGTTIGEFIVKLYKKQRISLKMVHVIGHSLGCQITAYVGQEVIRQTGTKVYRITGLDVGTTTYIAARPSERLSKNDADIVDIIHTTGGLIGIEQAVGTVDFYPNGGTYKILQPGCKPIPMNPLTKYNYIELSTAFCSHHRSYIYFAYSINTDKILGTKCSSYEKYEKGKCKKNEKAVFGENYVPGPEGKFYLNMNCTGPTQCVYDY